MATTSTGPRPVVVPKPRNGTNKRTSNGQEGAGNNDERELPERLRTNDADVSKHRPPTNFVPDRERDPAKPTYLEIHPKDEVVNL